jgi:dTDP-4-amino-4,6-dideoxygalactose transaminase
MINWVPNKQINHDRVKEILQKSITTNQFTNGGPAVDLLEKTIRNILKIDNNKSIICVSNGTVALWAAVAAIELYNNKDLQFCTQSFTFPASAQAYLNNVIIVDIDNNGGIDLNQIDCSKCDGIIVTNVFGNVVDISKYEKWSIENNKYLIFDNAATSNTFYKGKNSCNYGTASTLSFHHTKPIGFGEGGCIIIDKEYERSLRNILNFGIDNSSPLGKWHRKGGNYKMSDIQAAYILQYLDGFDAILQKTTDLYEYFLDKIAPLSSIKTFPNFSDGTPFVSCISIFSENSNEIIKELLNHNIYCRKYYNPLIASSVATKFYDNIICISLTVDMNIEDIDKIVHLIKNSLKD